MLILKELPKQVQELINKQVWEYTTPLILLNQSNPLLSKVGSGTYAIYNNRIIIIVAAHVNRDIEINKLPVFVPNFINGNLEPLPIKSLFVIDNGPSINKESYSHTPDLGIIDLPDNFNLEIKGKKAWNILSDKEKFINNSEKFLKNDWIWVAAGCPTQDAKMIYDDQQRRELFDLPYQGTYLGGRRYQEYIIKIDGQDYPTDTLLLDINEDNSPAMPLSFGGISGGGVWQVALNDKLEIAEMFFGGLVSAQSPSYPRNYLIAKGPKSIYLTLLPLYQFKNNAAQ